MESFEYSYYAEGFEEVMEFLTEFGLAFLGVAVVLLLVVLAVALVCYVLGSIGLYTIAKRRGIHNPWLAWLPIGKQWIVGCISDQYQYVVKEKIRNKRKILLILSLVSLVVNAVLQTTGNAAVMSLIMESDQSGALARGAISIVSNMICSGISIASLVFYYMAMYDLYTSCCPQNNILYLVFSIIFRVSEPFFLFFNRKQDGGMPPRREPVRPEPVQYSYIPETPNQDNRNEPEQM